MMITKLFAVYGQVQGVGFRYFTLQEAGRLGVKGYVRNRHDGSVEVVACADSETLSKFHHWLQQGPRTSSVERVIESEYAGSEVFEHFEIRR